MMRFVLETDRLALRELSLADLDFVAEMLADPEVMRFYPKRYSREESAGWIERQLERYLRDGHGLWLVVERETDEPVGQVGLTVQQVDGVAEPEVGYLVHRPFWRRGFAAEAAAATRDHAFRELDLPRVISLIRPENLPSQGVARRIGMQPVGRAMHAGIEHLVFARSRAAQSRA
jgi:RimJ/RimL family protein N-acetyltransferase